MRRFGWILLASCLTVFELWAVFVPTGPMNLNNHPVLFSSILFAFFFSSIGGWWMFLRILRKEKRIFPHNPHTSIHSQRVPLVLL
jgi:hypothetical protein